ncbi:hypothetical protein AURMO_00070 [Aurantimicrobium photophilum]|jgi:hypothetical protein|uniref:Uncharacterized protein n=1 Tax=Aurantimicrobium photophilum TaxID=1987356 RepID=A0A2Z3RUU1_9MICO|nr:hypothetical protein AURMO_00070 [Aurantimicrobium photophilum]
MQENSAEVEIGDDALEIAAGGVIKPVNTTIPTTYKEPH